MTPAVFIEQLRTVSLTDVFNPYADTCLVYDAPTAPDIRLRTLHAMLIAAAGVEVDALWIGRDLGHRGGRRTGLALTDDVHLLSHSGRWGIEIVRPTVGDELKERTAAVIWTSLGKIASAVFLWNVFPFHPHEPGDPFSNRAHTRTEARLGEDILWQLVRILRPQRIVAIGNDATRVVSKGDLPVIQVRHPSYGGQSAFTRQIGDLYRLH